MIGFILGISITLNIITILGIFIAYKKFMKNNPLSAFYRTPKKKHEEDIISKLKNKAEMENWDI